MTIRLRQYMYTLLLVVLIGCEKPVEKEKHVAPTYQRPPAASTVLVTVNGDTITAQELRFAINRTFPNSDQVKINDEVQSKVLDSLIAAKVMEQSIKNKLSDEEKAEIKYQVAAYKQELYVRKYLSDHVIPQPVTTQMVENYYQQNQIEFGAMTSRSFELLVATTAPTEQQRNAFLEQAATVASDKDWKTPVEYMKKRFGIQYQRAEAIPDTIDPRLRAIIDRLDVGESSGVNFIEGKPVMARVTGEQVLPAKPLNEVSAQIRRRLAPIQLRETVKDVTAQLISEAKVVKQ